MVDILNRPSEEELIAASKDFTEVYETDELRFLMDVSSGSDVTKRPTLVGFFKIGPHYPSLAQKNYELFTALEKSKKVRARLIEVEPRKLRDPITMAFLTQLDDSPYTRSLLEDVLAARLANPVTPSSSSIERELKGMTEELRNAGITGQLTTQLVMEQILNSNLKLNSSSSSI